MVPSTGNGFGSCNCATGEKIRTGPGLAAPQEFQWPIDECVILDGKTVVWIRNTRKKRGATVVRHYTGPADGHAARCVTKRPAITYPLVVSGFLWGHSQFPPIQGPVLANSRVRVEEFDCSTRSSRGVRGMGGAGPGVGALQYDVGGVPRPFGHLLSFSSKGGGKAARRATRRHSSLQHQADPGRADRRARSVSGASC